MKIAVLVEGTTEKAFKRALDTFLRAHLSGRMPRLSFVLYNGLLPKEAKLRSDVARLLRPGEGAVAAVIALTDVYTGKSDFVDAADAKAKMRSWVGDEPRFHPHAAQHDFEAWLLPYWPKIQRLAKHNKARPAGSPEGVNHQSPPSARIAEIYRIGSARRHYSKVRDAEIILRDEDLGVAAAACPELKALLDTILTLCGASPLA